MFKSSYKSPPSWCGDKWINAFWPTDGIWWHRPGQLHDDVIKWKHFPRYWPFVRGIHGALIFSLISVWINGWVNNREAGDLRRYHAHYDVGVMVARVMAWCTKPLPQPLLANYQRWLVLTHPRTTSQKIFKISILGMNMKITNLRFSRISKGPIS